MDHDAFFDPSDVDTPAGMQVTTSMSQIDGIPSVGTGLHGEVFVPGTSIWNVNTAWAASISRPDAEFTATTVSYGSRDSEATIADFLAHDAGSITGNGNLEFGPSALTLEGYIYIPPGVHEISVVSDDGFDLRLGGEKFSEYSGGRAMGETSRVSEFEGGLYELQMVYFDGGGSMHLTIEIDGLPLDSSALYQSPQDFLNPPNGVDIIDVDDYHPSFTITEALADGTEGRVTGRADTIEGDGGDNVINGKGGDDNIKGGYGDDIVRGGVGDDVLDGGRGSDLVQGGAGDDIIVSRSDAGIQRIGQLAIGEPSRGDPDNEVNDALQQLFGYENQSFVSDDILIGGEGRDTFLFTQQINAKLDIIHEHIKADGSINWGGVAGENDELHDHWVDAFGIDLIGDFNAEEDHIAVIGHTANVYVEHRDVIGDDALESIVTVVSNQHGNGGAHDYDLLGQIIVHGDLVYADDIQTDDGVTYGVVEDYADLAEAIVPEGETKITEINGVEYQGYDTRGPMNMNMNMDMEMDHAGGHGIGTNVLGAITGNPQLAFDNDFFNESAHLRGADAYGEVEPTRDPFDQLETVEVAGKKMSGGAGNNYMSSGELSDQGGLPGAIGYWSFANGRDGAYADLRGELSDIKAYTLYESQAVLRTDGKVRGPDGTPNSALYFDGEDDFAYLAHNEAMEVSQGTIALWIRPDDLTDDAIFLSKDANGSKDGGHFRLGHTDDGGLFLRFAEGDGGSNQSWETGPLLTEGAWHHVAVSFTDGGVTVFLDGTALRNGEWDNVEGDVPVPSMYKEAYLLQNEEPWVFGADTSRTKVQETAQEFATDNDDLRNEFEGAIAEFGIWGGMDSDDALKQGQVRDLMNNGPRNALTNDNGPEAMLVSDDYMEGKGGSDTMMGGAGDDSMHGGGGRDSMEGGYGDDRLRGNAGDDTLDGGRGSDLLEGGDGNDVLISRSDAGEQRLGQLILGEPSRDFPDASIDPEYLKLVDWIDQDLVADDILVGGKGRDHFKFETLLNGKADILLENVMDDGRMIHWHGVAGENARLHDHWVDGFGIDIIADYSAVDDTISVMGHTTEIEVDYVGIDTDGDGITDDAVSVITAYSQQGKNGGAHDEDYLGYIVVYGDRVEEEDVLTDAGAHYGIVDTIDELQEAVAPNGETKWTDLGGSEMHLGYDTRDIEGDPMGLNPGAFSSNKWLGTQAVDLVSAIDSDWVKPRALIDEEGGTFGGGNPPIEIEHTDLMARNAGTWAMSFTANNPGNGNDQALFSKDHSGYKDGGHITGYINSQGVLKVRFQGTDGEESLYKWSEKIEAGVEYHMAFTFGNAGLNLYLNGELIDSADSIPGGMTGNTEDLVIGASTRTRWEDDDNLQWHFDGEIENIVMLNRPLSEVEVLLLAEAGGDLDALDPDLYNGDGISDAPVANISGAGMSTVLSSAITSYDPEMAIGETASMIITSDDVGETASLLISSEDVGQVSAESEKAAAPIMEPDFFTEQDFVEDLAFA